MHYLLMRWFKMELNCFENIKKFIKKLEIDRIITIKEKKYFDESLKDSYEDFLIND